MFQLSYIVLRMVFCVFSLNQATSDYEIAHSKPARQSFTYNNNNNSYAASMAVDGDPGTSSMAAVGGNSPDIGWWQVDLGEIYKITRMTIVNSNDGYAYQSLSTYTVFIGSTNATDYTWEGTTCYYNTSNTPVPRGGQISFNCSQQPTRGRYVTIRRYPAYMNLWEFRQDMISLSEVHVYTNETVYRLDYLKNATQSHTYIDTQGYYTASAAVDGNMDTCSSTAIDGTSTEVGWWQVNLGDVYTVTGFEIINKDNPDINGNSPVNQYMTDFAVFVDSINSTGDSLASNKLCLNYSNNGIVVPSEQPISGDCSRGPMHGRYVIIRKQGSYRPDALVLCEVYIYGYEDSTISTNTALTSSSSTTKHPTTKTPTLIYPPSSTSKAVPISSSTTTTLAMLELSSSSSDSNRFCDPCPCSPQGSCQSPDSQRNAIIVGVVLGSLLLISIITNICTCRRLCLSKLFDESSKLERSDTKDDVAGPLTQSALDGTHYMHLNTETRKALNQGGVSFQGDNLQATYTGLDFRQPDNNVYNEINTSMATHSLNLPADSMNIAYEELPPNTSA